VERRIQVARTARYHLVGDPSVAEEVWFVLHGYGQLAARFLTGFAALPGAGGRRVVVAPEALSRFYLEREVGPHGRTSRVGASWMTSADREGEIRDYVGYLDRVAAEVGEGIRPGLRKRLVVLGFSQGSETASRWVAYGSVAPAQLILWGGGLAEDLDMARAARAMKEVQVTLVIGDRDSWGQERAAASVARLQAAGIPVETVVYPGEHRIEGEVLLRF
jgi:predicted esterase